MDDIKNVYLPMEFTNFKIEGRGSQCFDFGIPTILHDKAGVPNQC